MHIASSIPGGAFFIELIFNASNSNVEHEEGVTILWLTLTGVLIQEWITNYYY